MILNFYDRKSYRFTGGWINGAGIILPSLLILPLLAFAGYSLFVQKASVPWRTNALLIILLIAEIVVSVRTFFPEVSLGPNSALQNLPLLMIDQMWAIILNNLFISRMHNLRIYAFYGVIGVETIMKLLVVLLFSFRYIGLAWTDEKCILKRIVCPIRYEKHLEEAVPI